ncbi:hypothetical protein MVEN_02256800 [Mycena venus]|uniref:CxC2-like cysteine cluster KDZ transposase-associated domain-containing protein n=1 Tax=Mycena venus TaxID=2733690 RepID=A0A8H6X649_9AGAR|nr:hypothetical protein MVEN_02256800 [Mycena venus]
MSKRNSDTPGHEPKRHRSSNYRATGVRFAVPVDPPPPSSAHVIAPVSSAAPVEQLSIPRASRSNAPLIRGALVTWNASEPSPEPSTSIPGDSFINAAANMRPPEEPRNEPPKSSKPKRSHGQSTILGALLPQLPTMQNHILGTFTHWQLGQPCECKSTTALFRCLECFNSPMWCRTCIVQQHRYTPFHHIEKWSGKYFERDSMATDRILHLHLGRDSQGHITQNCPDKPPGPPQRYEFTVCDHNGFHTRFIEFCSCIRSDEQRWEQLLAVRLFPSTIQQPKTTFTFNVMKEFQIHSLASKKSAYDYVKALCQLTSNAEPDTVTPGLAGSRTAAPGQDRLMELIPMSLIAALILLLSDAQHVLKHKFTLFISTDGNFKLQRKNKRDDPDDIALNAGNGYFIPLETFKKHLDALKPSEDTSTCSHLKAARMQNIAKFKNAVITGVVAVQCARHGFYLPQSFVDLIKGEGFGYTDTALRSGLGEEAKTLRWIILAYDIWCQYKAKLLARIKDSFPEMLSVFERIEGVIGKMHILNHQERCMFAFNLNFLFCVGLTTGELIETGWAEHNLTAGSTKEMNDGHRHDVIDGTCDHWNWGKTLRLDGKTVSIFENEGSSTTAPPTHSVAYSKLRAQENRMQSPVTATHEDDLAFIVDALRVDNAREKVRAMVALLADEDTLRSIRQSLYTEIEGLRTRLMQRVPMLEEHMKRIDPDKPEDAPVYLPSEFGVVERRTFKLEALGHLERELREVEALAALEELRTAIRTLNWNLKTKQTDIHAAGDRYRRIRSALVNLGMPENDSTFQPLHRNEQHGKGGRGLQLGDSRQHEPWFWHAQRPAGLTEEAAAAWETEMDRVQWFRERALMQRATEEVEILTAEFSRAIEFFRKTSDIWKLMAVGNLTNTTAAMSTPTDSPTYDLATTGRSAYASKQAAIYSQFQVGCKKAWDDLPELVRRDQEREEKKAKAKAVEMGAQTLINDYSKYYEGVENL